MKIEENENEIRIKLSDELSIEQVSVLKNEIEMTTKIQKSVVVDINTVTGIDIPILQLLVSVKKTVLNNGCKFSIDFSQTSNEILSKYELCGFKEHLLHK